MNAIPSLPRVCPIFLPSICFKRRAFDGFAVVFGLNPNCAKRIGRHFCKGREPYHCQNGRIVPRETRRHVVPPFDRFEHYEDAERIFLKRISRRAVSHGKPAGLVMCEVRPGAVDERILSFA